MANNLDRKLYVAGASFQTANCALVTSSSVEPGRRESDEYGRGMMCRDRNLRRGPLLHLSTGFSLRGERPALAAAYLPTIRKRCAGEADADTRKNGHHVVDRLHGNSCSSQSTPSLVIFTNHDQLACAHGVAEPQMPTLRQLIRVRRSTWQTFPVVGVTMCD